MWLLVIRELKKHVFADSNLKEIKNLDCMSLTHLKNSKLYIYFLSCYVCVRWGEERKKLNTYKEKVSFLAWLILIYFSKNAEKPLYSECDGMKF